MFSKISRYYKVPDVAVPDAQGRVFASKDLRLLPAVTGTFQHVVKAGDRLDHLSHKYYSQPLQWWHICDANPEFLSPLALLGDEVIVTTRFPVTIVPRLLFDLAPRFQRDLEDHLISASLRRKFSDRQRPLTENAFIRIESQGNQWQLLDGEQAYVIIKSGTILKVNEAVPVWEALFRELHGVLGVEDVQVMEETELVPVVKTDNHRTVEVFRERFHWEVHVRYNRINVTSETLAKRIELAGFNVETPERIGPLGQEIVIPPKVIG